ncbi:MAG: hypothetical protein ABJB01_00005 [Rudaea sp.]
MRLVSALLSLLLVPGFVSAQTDVSAPETRLPQLSSNTSPRIFDQLFYSPATIGNGSASQPAGVMPLWSTADGRILAIVALGSGSASLPTLSPAPQFGSAADWKLIDVTDFFSTGTALRLRENVNAYARFDHSVMLTPMSANATSLGCSPAFNMSIDSRCLSAEPRANSNALHLGVALNAGDVDVDLSYGLSWLRPENEQRFSGMPQQPFWDLFGGMNGTGAPTLVIPGLELATIQNSGINASGRWHFAENQSLDLSAEVGRIQLELPGSEMALPGINQAALSVGLRRGDFSGVVVGHVIGPADMLNNGQRWSSVDLGISWRAPWRGVFSVGAQNLWSSGNGPTLAEPAAHESDPSQSRVPYVQYHQDL